VWDMSRLFYGSSFNEDIANWDTSGVFSMKEMFREANKFNQPI
jgi:hypothetical protein